MAMIFENMAVSENDVDPKDGNLNGDNDDKP